MCLALPAQPHLGMHSTDFAGVAGSSQFSLPPVQVPSSLGCEDGLAASRVVLGPELFV